MKCSIIVANYNNATVIRQALQSIEQQTYTNWEVVIVDDGSTDDSLQTIESFLATVPDKTKYKVVVLPENSGVGNAKKTGVSEGTGELIFILDADDALAPEALAILTKAHEQNPAASLLYSTHYTCDENLKPLKVTEPVEQVKKSDLLEDSISHLVSIKRYFYNQTQGFDADFILAEDKDLYYKLEEVGEVVFVNKPLYFYRISNKGISRGFDAFVRSRDYKLSAIKNAVKRRRKSGVKMPSKQQLRNLLSEIHLLQAEGLIYSEQRLGTKFLKHLGLAILYNPLGSINRKIKAAFILSRIKRELKKQL